MHDLCISHGLNSQHLHTMVNQGKNIYQYPTNHNCTTNILARETLINLMKRNSAATPTTLSQSQETSPRNKRKAKPTTARTTTQNIHSRCSRAQRNHRDHGKRSRAPTPEREPGRQRNSWTTEEQPPENNEDDEVRKRPQNSSAGYGKRSGCSRAPRKKKRRHPNRSRAPTPERNLVRLRDTQMHITRSQSRSNRVTKGSSEDCGKQLSEYAPTP